jgi:chloramphenicol 3-O-phosphotransferase
MAQAHEFGQIVILNGVPRSGKSSIAAVIQDTFDGLWMNQARMKRSTKVHKEPRKESRFISS